MPMRRWLGTISVVLGATFALNCGDLNWSDLSLGTWEVSVWGAEPFVPRQQTQPPGPPLSPSDAVKKMQVPEGFHVEIVASEPDIEIGRASCRERV